MPEPSRRPPWIALAVVGWLAAVGVATGLTIGAVSLIGTGLFGGTTAPLSAEEVALALAAASSEPSVTPPPVITSTASPGPTITSPSTTASPTKSAATTASPTKSATTKAPATSAAVAFSRAGNTVVARCASGAAHVVSWSPAQGYHVSGGVNQHGDEAEVGFESANNRVRIRVACVGQQPTAEIDD